MPKKWLRDSDGTIVLIKDWEEGNVDIRNFPEAFIKYAVEDRTWTGKLSATESLSGFREVYLKYKTDYIYDLDAAAHAIAGEIVHANLAQFALNDSEIALHVGNTKGVADRIEKHGDETWLVDYKHQGAYSVKKFLGYIHEVVEVLDEAGRPVRFKSGKRKGQIKTKKELVYRPETRRDNNITWQLNIYRYLALEMGLVPSIDKLKVFFIIRDGKTMAARNIGIEGRTLMEDVEILPLDEVKTHLIERSEAMLDYMRTETLPPVCTQEECWEGRKCSGGYCEVSAMCKHMDPEGWPGEEEE
jgi:hypothetical protein